MNFQIVRQKKNKHEDTKTRSLILRSLRLPFAPLR